MLPGILQKLTNQARVMLDQEREEAQGYSDPGDAALRGNEQDLKTTELARR